MTTERGGEVFEREGGLRPSTREVVAGAFALRFPSLFFSFFVTLACFFSSEWACLSCALCPSSACRAGWCDCSGRTLVGWTRMCGRD